MVKIFRDKKYSQRIYFELERLREVFYLVLGNHTVNVLLNGENSTLGDKKFNSSLSRLYINPFSPEIKMYIFLPVFLTFLMEIVRRICLNIKTPYPR